MITKEEILAECKKALQEDQFLVDIKVKNSNNFIVFIDGYSGINIEECKRINKQICSAFDREVEDFSLEISSPGLDKAFKVKEQYIKNKGNQIEVLYVDGEKITGDLIEVNNDDIQVLEKSEKKKEQQEIKINFNDIKSAKIVLKF